MFQPRSTDFPDSRVSAILDHLRAIEKELAAIGRTTGRSASAKASAVGEKASAIGDKASAAGDQIAGFIGPILNDVVDRLRRRQRSAVDGVAALGNQAVKIGAQAGNDALARVACQVKERPLLTLAVAVGVGILIGAAGAGAGRRP